MTKEEKIKKIARHYGYEVQSRQLRRMEEGK